MPFAFKAGAVIALLLIVFSLGSSLFFLLRDGGQSERAVKALTIRIGLSVLLFVLLMVGYATGYFSYPVAPHP